tara:strand:+ start:457 stop:858 length:402 start_codon:yes stop_codon:yes gene_type:complete
LKKSNYNTLDEVFKQARKEQGSVKLDGLGYEASIFLGVKISRDNLSGEVKIYDPIKSINYYVEIEEEQYESFKQLGWRKAVIDLSLLKYKDKLDRIKESIGREMNGNRSPKRLRILKESREQILRKYYKLLQK